MFYSLFRKQKMKIRRLTIIALIAVLLFCTGFIIFLFPFYQYMKYNSNQEKTISDDFLVELPLNMDSNGYFLVPCIINGTDSVKLIVDNKATSLMTEDALKKHNVMYWGKLPFPSKNAYGEKTKNNLYIINDFKIHTHSVGQPIFKEIKKDNLIHDKVNSGVIGINIIKLLTWKFSLDEQKIILFSRSDSCMLQKETVGFFKLDNGLGDNSIQLQFAKTQQKQKFSIDLGYRGDIEVDNETTELLKPQFDYQIIHILRSRTRKETVTLFENVEVLFNGISIPNAQIINNVDVNANYVGADFMKRFNFLLSYPKRSHKTLSVLYIKKRSDLEKVTPKRYISAFEFNIKKYDNKIIVSALTEGGLAQTSGLQLGDEILEIDGSQCTQFSPEEFIKYAEEKNCITLKLDTNKSIIINK